MDTERCKSIDQISAMDASKSHAAGLRRTRPTTTTEEEEEVINSGNYSGKRRRFFHPRKNDQIQCRNGVDVNFRDEVVSSTESGSNCDRLPSPKQKLSLDLKAEPRFEIETESKTSMSSNDGFSRETSSSSEICLDLQQMQSSSTLKNKPAGSPPAARKKPPAASITPTAAEIEEFFSVAEKKEKERFANKYNYDIVNDVPMDGRYQWVRLKP